jgi:replicative DNA helicase
MNNYKQKQEAGLSDYVFGKTPPQAIDLEEAVLGAILLDREALPAVIDILKPDSFYKPAHAEIYRACLSLLTKGDAVDILTVTEQLRTNKSLESVGGSYYLVELTNRVASSANLEYHARIVAQKALAREQIRVANEAIQSAYDEGTDAFDLLYHTQKQLFDLSNFSGRQAQDVGRIGLEVVRQLDRAMAKGDGMTGVPTGIKALDSLTGGWQSPDLIVLAARPGMGKTAFTLNCSVRAAMEGFPVAFFSLEMASTQLVQRVLSSKPGISSNRIQRGDVTTDEARRIGEAAQALAELPLYIDDSSGLNIFELRAKARRLKIKHDIKLIVIDYLQLMSGSTDKRGGNREQEISEISRGLKTLAKELDVPIIALSQLSRAVEVRGGSKRPQLSDLRESGAIEQDSDIVGFLYRPEYYGIMEDEHGRCLKGVTELSIDKHRNGALDKVEMFFEAHTTTFYDASKKDAIFPHQTAQDFQNIPPAAINAARANDDDIPF